MASKIETRHKLSKPKDPQRKDGLDGLEKIYSYLALQYPHSSLDAGDLRNLQIETVVSLEEAEPQFFVPFDQGTFDELWAKAQLREESDPEDRCEWPTFWLSGNYAHACHLHDFIRHFCGQWPDHEKSLEEHGPWNRRVTDNTFLENSLGCAPGGEHYSIITDVFDNASLARPHLGCTILDNAEMDEGLLWSEVLSAVSLMMRKRIRKEYTMHKLIPVFIVTLAGKKARVLQAHFDTHLVIQKSRIIDLGKENYDGIKYLIRWTMCQPKGNTLCDTPAKGFR